MATMSRELAEWCAGIAPADVPADVLEAASTRLLDTVGLIVAGARTPAVEIARTYASSLGGLPQSTVIGCEGRVPSSSAALVHGVAAHCYDFDDTLPDSVVHPGSIVIPTALAVAEARSATASEFLAAITIGYEVAARVGAVAGRKFHARELHASGVVGPIVAAAVAARLNGLNAEQISWAIGLAASMGGGNRAYAKDGGWSKWLHLGWAAHGGIVAADLASRGFRGPEHVLDGGSDLYSTMLFGEQLDRSPLLADLGRVWRGASAEFKLYPCAHVIHPYIEAVLSILDDEGLRAADIERVECVIAPWAAAIACEPREAKLKFTTELEAIGSLPYQVAVTILERKVTVGALSGIMRARSDIAEMAQRIDHRTNAGLGRTFDGTVEIRTRSGAMLVRNATLPKVDTAKIRDKFIHAVEPTIGKPTAEEVADRILASPDWRPVVEFLASPKPSRSNTGWAGRSLRKYFPTGTG
jgi:2-methylcitrate dehydratase PrpD